MKIVLQACARCGVGGWIDGLPADQSTILATLFRLGVEVSDHRCPQHARELAEATERYRAAVELGEMG